MNRRPLYKKCHLSVYLYRKKNIVFADHIKMWYFNVLFWGGKSLFIFRPKSYILLRKQNSIFPSNRGNILLQYIFFIKPSFPNTLKKDKVFVYCTLDKKLVIIQRTFYWSFQKILTKRMKIVNNLLTRHPLYTL